jgi:hypothetical protein
MGGEGIAGLLLCLERRWRFFYESMIPLAVRAIEFGCFLTVSPAPGSPRPSISRGSYRECAAAASEYGGSSICMNTSNSYS